MESQVNISLFALYLAYTAFYMIINIKKPLLNYKMQNRAFKACFLTRLIFGNKNPRQCR